MYKDIGIIKDSSRFCQTVTFWSLLTLVFTDRSDTSIEDFWMNSGPKCSKFCSIYFLLSWTESLQVLNEIMIAFDHSNNERISWFSSFPVVKNELNSWATIGTGLQVGKLACENKISMVDFATLSGFLKSTCSFYLKIYFNHFYGWAK